MVSQRLIVVKHVSQLAALRFDFEFCVFNFLLKLRMGHISLGLTHEKRSVIAVKSLRLHLIIRIVIEQAIFRGLMRLTFTAGLLLVMKIF